MTVVAEGAAIYAAAQPMQQHSGITDRSEDQSPGTVLLELRHPSVTDDSEVVVGVRAQDPASEVEIESADGGWRSGRLPLRDGATVTRLPLRQRGGNRFEIHAFDGTGVGLACSPNSFSVQRGLTADSAPLSRSIGVVLRDDSTGRKAVEWILKKGTALPASATVEFRTTLALEPGGEEEVVGVYLVEGEARRPERNRQVGSILITDSHVPRTIPAGVPVEIRIDVSASRLLTARVFLPYVDMQFDVDVSLETENVSPSNLSQALLEERERIEEVAPFVSANEMSELHQMSQRTAEAVRTVSDSDPGSSQRALVALHSLQEAVDDADSTAELDRLRVDGEAALADARRTVSTMGSESQQRRIDALGRELEMAKAGDDLAQVERSISKIRRLDFEVLGAQPWFWKEWFEHLQARDQWTDSLAADRQIHVGTVAIARDDISGLRHAVLELARLAPGHSGAFENVGIRRS